MSLEKLGKYIHSSKLNNATIILPVLKAFELVLEAYRQKFRSAKKLTKLMLNLHQSDSCWCSKIARKWWLGFNNVNNDFKQFHLKLFFALCSWCIHKMLMKQFVFFQMFMVVQDNMVLEHNPGYVRSLTIISVQNIRKAKNQTRDYWCMDELTDVPKSVCLLAYMNQLVSSNKTLML